MITVKLAAFELAVSARTKTEKLKRQTSRLDQNDLKFRGTGRQVRPLTLTLSPDEGEGIRLAR
jgi:hypothetical protein